MAWDALDANGDNVRAVVQSAAQAVSHLREASHALQALEAVRLAQQQSLAQHHPHTPAAGGGGDSSSEGAADSSTSAGSSSVGDTTITSSSGGGGGAVNAQDASDRVEAALMRLLLSERKGRTERQQAYQHLRMVLETYVSLGWARGRGLG
jgi:hypothetical protein